MLRLLKTRLKLGTVKGPKNRWDDIPYAQNDCPEHHKLALKAAEKTLILLKNDGLLPLDKAKIKTVAVIGPNADSAAALKANYNGTPSVYETVLRGVQNYLGDSARVLYAPGCDIYRDKTEACAAAHDRISEAVSAASAADAVILCTGLDASLKGEEGDGYNSENSGDKADLSLPEPQRELMRALARFGKKVTLVNLSGSAVDLLFVKEHFGAVIQGWYPGQMGAGRLPGSYTANTARPAACP